MDRRFLRKIPCTLPNIFGVVWEYLGIFKIILQASGCPFNNPFLTSYIEGTEGIGLDFLSWREFGL